LPCAATNKKASTRLAFLLRSASRLRFAPPAQAETGEAEAEKGERAGFGDGQAIRLPLQKRSLGAKLVEITFPKFKH
jgi:hypothetical protein